MMEKFKKKDGAVSIMIVVALLVGVFIIAGSVEIVKRSHTMNEIGYIMDIASVTALRSGVDEEKLRAEEFAIDKSMVIRNYHSMVDQSLDNYGHIVSHKHVKTKVEGFKETWGLGQTGKAREQVLIDSTVLLKVHSNNFFDTIPAVGKRFYDARSNSDFEITYNGVGEDNLVELSVRSVSRVVYR